MLHCIDVSPYTVMSYVNTRPAAPLWLGAGPHLLEAGEEGTLGHPLGGDSGHTHTPSGDGVNHTLHTPHDDGCACLDSGGCLFSVHWLRSCLEFDTDIACRALTH